MLQSKFYASERVVSFYANRSLWPHQAWGLLFFVGDTQDDKIKKPLYRRFRIVVIESHNIPYTTHVESTRKEKTTDEYGYKPDDEKNRDYIKCVVCNLGVNSPHEVKRETEKNHKEQSDPWH